LVGAYSRVQQELHTTCRRCIQQGFETAGQHSGAKCRVTCMQCMGANTSR
jgi:hypothetical protein